MHAPKIFFAFCPALLAACGGAVTSGSGGNSTTSTTSSVATTSSGATGTGGAGTSSSSTSSGAAGGGGSPSTGAGGACATTPTFAEVLAKPLSSCSGFEPPCHNHAAGTLTIDPTMQDYTWAQLVNVPAYIVGAGDRVVPGDPAKSFLYRKLTDDLGPNDGSPMPKSGLATGWNELPADELEMVRCWILEGAPNN